ncbi:uncharacterized protein LOC113302986 [Papaver somniferum]|nr:uncharacterized protein LOC113302986 [Papaver somniferum]
MVVEMRDSSIPVALEINDVKPLLGPLHTVPGSQQETEIPNGASNVEPRVAAELDKISVVGCTGAMSEMDIREEKFAGCSNAVPDSGVNSHGSTKDKEMIPLEYLDSMFSVWENRNDNTPIQYKIKCVVYDIAEMWFKKWETYECLVNVTDGSRESMVLIPLEGTMLLEMNENSSVPVNLELNDEKTSFDFRWFKVHRGF